MKPECDGLPLKRVLDEKQGKNKSLMNFKGPVGLHSDFGASFCSMFMYRSVRFTVISTKSEESKLVSKFWMVNLKQQCQSCVYSVGGSREGGKGKVFEILKSFS